MTKQLLAKTLFLSAFVFGATPLLLQASTPVDVHWQDMCDATRNQKLTITKSDGTNVEGYCISVNVTEMHLATENHRVEKLARGTFTRVFAKPDSRHELHSLHEHLHGALAAEFEGLLSEKGPLFLIAIPPTLAWGAVSVPFCALGDLKRQFDTVKEIRVI